MFPMLLVLVALWGLGPDTTLGDEVVREWTLEMAAQRGGSVKAYRPAADRPRQLRQPAEHPARTRD